MIKEKKLLERFNSWYYKKRKTTFEERLEMYEKMYEWAKELKKIPLKNIFEDIEKILRIGHFLNHKND